MPTETVYGLAADAKNEAAIAKVFELKGRPTDHPLIVHLAQASWMEQWAKNIPKAAKVLAARFWPGPMTLILQKHDHVSDTITGGQSTIALRVPAHPVAQSLLQSFGGALVAPSANRYGRISPTSAAHVVDEFGADLPIILDGGDCSVGIESTIIDCSDDRVRILRPGMISAQQISEEIGQLSHDLSEAPRVSGSTQSHYAPITPAQLLGGDRLHKRIRELHAAGRSFAVLACGKLPDNAQGIALSADPEAYAQELYAALRSLDGLSAEIILSQEPPGDPAWAAIHDRLSRASANK